MTPRRGKDTVPEIDPFATATELLHALRGGEITSAELADVYIRRIERYDGALNAVVVRDFERARGGPAPPMSPRAGASGSRSSASR